ncbi:hypothetical protein [Patulibacter defluvii]|uniref:hypothetical protein n=1 Tax=Patulibacter defluvii TaxID=3095358 RepID=UPI002A74B013|nr:hypothetical protein [Patulibacter sp. DM4]
MDPVRVADGLWRWTTPHPDWRPSSDPERPNSWERDVGSVLVEAADATVLIDPLVADDGWGWIDGRVGDRGRPVVVLTTLKWHRRSRDAVVARYDASDLRPGGGRTLPAGIEPIRLRGAGETVYWLPDAAALVPGDRILGGHGGRGLRLNPDSWMTYLSRPPGRAGLARLLRPLLELPIERVLVSHGAPVLRDGRAALAAALEEHG